MIGTLQTANGNRRRDSPGEVSAHDAIIRKLLASLTIPRRWDSRHRLGAQSTGGLRIRDDTILDQPSVRKIKRVAQQTHGSDRIKPGSGGRIQSKLWLASRKILV